MEISTQLLLIDCIWQGQKFDNIQFITTYKTKIFTILDQGGNNNSVTMLKVNRVQKDEKGERWHWKKNGQKIVILKIEILTNKHGLVFTKPFNNPCFYS
jgi:hypothetical protein